jgi:hypothetical protein
MLEGMTIFAAGRIGYASRLSVIYQVTPQEQCRAGKP